MRLEQQAGISLGALASISRRPSGLPVQASGISGAACQGILAREAHGPDVNAQAYVTRGWKLAAWQARMYECYASTTKSCTVVYVMSCRLAYLYFLLRRGLGAVPSHHHSECGT